MNIQKYLNDGYTIDVETKEFIQLRKKKKPSLLLFGLGALLAIVGVGFLLIGLGLLDYILKNDEVITLSKLDKI